MNTVFATLIPIAIIIVLPVLFLIGKAKSRTFSVKITHWLLIVYSAVLLLSLVIVSFIKFEKPITHEEKGINLYDAVYDGKILDIGQDYILEDNSYEFKGDTLSITSPNFEESSTLFIDRKKEQDNRIDVSIYGKGLYVNGIDLSEKLNLPSLRLDGETLTIVYPDHQELKMALVKNEFTINQFKGESIFNQSYHFDRPIIYLQIPQNVELKDNPDMFIQYINK